MPPERLRCAHATSAPRSPNHGWPAPLPRVRGLHLRPRACVYAHDKQNACTSGLPPKLAQVRSGKSSRPIRASGGLRVGSFSRPEPKSRRMGQPQPCVAARRSTEQAAEVLLHAATQRDAQMSAHCVQGPDRTPTCLPTERVIPAGSCIAAQLPAAERRLRQAVGATVGAPAQPTTCRHNTPREQVVVGLAARPQ